jgi:hypothetical protein
MSFSRYATEDSVISSETVVRGMWKTTNTASLNTFFTSSIVTSSYYVNVYDTSATSSVQFSIQYGHVSGSGSAPLNAAAVGRTPTRINYGQYRSLIYNDENSAFVFGTYTSPDFIALNIARSCYKDAIKPGSLTLQLSGSDSGRTMLSLTDDSVVNGSVTNFIGSNRYYTLISGSGGTAATSLAGVSGSYGLLFPDLGVILLNPKALSTNSGNGGIALNNINVTDSTNTANVNNYARIFGVIKGTTNTFTLQSEETVSSRYFFTRVKNNEYNYTTNPSIINNSGSLLYDTLINNPQTYFTTVGMYNDNNELLAVAKLSRPLIKDFTKEALIRIKLDY